MKQNSLEGTSEVSTQLPAQSWPSLHQVVQVLAQLDFDYLQEFKFCAFTVHLFPVCDHLHALFCYQALGLTHGQLCAPGLPGQVPACAGAGAGSPQPGQGLHLPVLKFTWSLSVYQGSPWMVALPAMSNTTSNLHSPQNFWGSHCPDYDCLVWGMFQKFTGMVIRKGKLRGVGNKLKCPRRAVQKRIVFSWQRGGW